MSIDPQEALIAQFSQFIKGELSVEDWKTITKEFGTGNIASDTTRFYRSKSFGDDDETQRTVDFLETVREENEEIAHGLMLRAYNMAGGASSEELEKFPALTVLEEEEIKEGAIVFPQFPVQVEPFLEIQNVPGTFYPDLIDQINQSYRLGIYDATLVLSRKLLENLVIDILRAKYGTDRIELYYDTNSRRFQPFYTLVENLESNLADFQHYSDALDDEFIRRLNSFRQTANRGAHSLETNISEGEIETYGDRGEELARTLFRLRNLI